MTRVLELKHVSVQDVAPLITAWRRPEGTVGQSSFPPGKIVLTDTVERIEEFARRLSVRLSSARPYREPLRTIYWRVLAIPPPVTAWKKQRIVPF